MNYSVGAHVSTAGGHTIALTKLHAMGGTVVQFFSASPRGWNAVSFSPEYILAFKTTKEQLGIKNIYFHASYLINFADKSNTGHMSKKVLIAEMNAGDQMDVRGSIIHTGSFKEKMPDLSLFVDESKYDVLYANIKEVLENTPDSQYFIIENAGNRKIGVTLEEIGKIIHAVDSPRLKVCLDTCHLHAAGYDITTPEKLDSFLTKFDSLIGLDRLEVFHINDSRDPLGSYRDRHENLGHGMVGDSVFRLLLNHPKTHHIPFILEVPGLDDNGPDEYNLDLFKSYDEHRS